ncbi:MAG: peptidylprolyl isomerase [Firmicutes bacterium]|nr:peptidylprolyl isomerase [Bacillota bacterium]
MVLKGNMRWVWGGVTASISLGLAGCGGSNPTSRTVAMVDRVKITQGELNVARSANQVVQGVHLDQTAAAAKSQVLSLVQQQAVIDWALGHHVATQSQATQQANSLIQTKLAPSMGGLAALKTRVSDGGLTYAQFQHYVANQMIVQDAFNRVTANVAQPTTSTAYRYYLNNQAFYVSPPEVLLRDITVPTHSLASSILSQIQHGASFAALAARDSRDSYKSQGGSRGWVQVGASAAIPKSWLTAVSSLKPGQMSIVKGPLGYSIIEVQASRAGATIPFSAVQPAIQAELLQNAKEKAFDSWAASLMKNQKVRLFNIG